MMFLNCPAYLDQDGATRCGLPAEVGRWFTKGSTDGPRAPPVEVDQRLLTPEQRVGRQVGTAQGILGQQPAGPGRHTARPPGIKADNLGPDQRTHRRQAHAHQLRPAPDAAQYPQRLVKPPGPGALHRPSGTADLALPITQSFHHGRGQARRSPCRQRTKEPRETVLRTCPPPLTRGCW
jgi:hypothetical protein